MFRVAEHVFVVIGVFATGAILLLAALCIVETVAKAKRHCPRCEAYRKQAKENAKNERSNSNT